MLPEALCRRNDKAPAQGRPYSLICRRSKLTCGGHSLQSYRVCTACLHLAYVNGPGRPADSLVDALAIFGGKLELLLFRHNQRAFSNDGLHLEAGVALQSTQHPEGLVTQSQKAFGEQSTSIYRMYAQRPIVWCMSLHTKPQTNKLHTFAVMLQDLRRCTRTSPWHAL